MSSYYSLLDDYYGTATVSSSNVWPAILTILALIGGVLVYFLFVKMKEEPKNKFVAKLRDFLSFKAMWIEALLKISYYVLTIYVILSSFSYIGTLGFVYFITYLIFGVVILRVAYEGAIVVIDIWKNTKAISDNTKKQF